MSGIARRLLQAALLTAAGIAVVTGAGCALRPPSPDTFSFAVMGDTPYNDREEQLMLGMIGEIDGQDVAFVVHIGDIKAGGNSPCTDELFQRRRTQFDASAHPFLLVPGDNDWTDCRRASNGSMNPLERLSKMREVFYPLGETLGKKRLAVGELRECVQREGIVCRCPGYPENRYWTDARGATFVTQNIQGSNNNSGFDEASNRELRCRNLANRLALEKAATQMTERGSAGLVIFLHADPFVESKDGAYSELLADLERIAARVVKPVLVVHGDTHVYRLDKPFKDAAGRPLSNVTRLETFGSPQVGWVRVTVDRADPAVFRIAPGNLLQ